MGASGFEDFADAVAAGSGRDAAPVPRAFGRITVLGAGPDARLIAALCLAEGAEVTLFSAYGAELEALAGGIALRGAGPVGSYQVNREGAPSIRTTAELDRAVAGAEVVFLTGPVHKQRTYAMVLADHVRDGQVLVLAPGRTFGALEAAWLLRIAGAGAAVTLVEAQGLPFWWLEEGSALHLSPAGPVAAATLPGGAVEVMAGLGAYLPGLVPATSLLHASFADGSGLVEAPALIVGGPALANGGPEIPMGGTPLPENATFAALLGAEHRRAIASLADERRTVARAFGVRDLPDDGAWIAAHAGALRREGARPVPGRAAATAMLRDAVIGSLVPLVSAARIAGIAVPMTEGMVATASALLGADLATAGRRLEALGVDGPVDAARRTLDLRQRGSA
ncbi:MAG: hypothetical protein AAGE18_15125 [Pseudomonadota bacterium]